MLSFLTRYGTFLESTLRKRFLHKCFRDAGLAILFLSTAKMSCLMNFLHSLATAVLPSIKQTGHSAPPSDDDSSQTTHLPLLPESNSEILLSDI